jgi:hypothetical protein
MSRKKRIDELRDDIEFHKRSLRETFADRR